MVHPLLIASLTATNVLGLADAIQLEKENVVFSIEGCIVAASGHRYIVLEDSTGAIELFQGNVITNIPPLSRGDRIHTSGTTCHHNDGSTIPIICGIRKFGHIQPEPPNNVQISDLKSGLYDNKLVSTHGTVKEIFQDEIDPEWHYLVLDQNKSSIYAAIHMGASCKDLSHLANTEIAIVGICIHKSCGSRRILDRVLAVQDLSELSILTPAPDNPFDVPPLSDLKGKDPEYIISAGRHNCVGKVLCLYGNNVLLGDTNGHSHVISIIDDRLPRPGMYIKTVGLPATDLYRINLTSAHWQEIPGKPSPQSAPQDISIRKILFDKLGRRMFKPFYHGQLLRLSGIVQDSSENRTGILFLKTEGELIPIDLSANRHILEKIPAFSTIEVTGICIMETSNWYSYSRFPHTTGMLIVPRTEEDVLITATPPWWTARRLMALVGTLVVILAGILIWNLSLRRLATRKGRELFREQLGHVKADLRTEERTRLAVELHDTLAQNLTGVSMELEAANDLRGDAPQPMLDHLGIAAKALKSCRDELRNCLWDLRSQALEESDISKAILRTLQPCVADSRLAVRFEVPRSRLSDNTAHALLRVIRELVVNAIRHGNASSVKVAGTIDGDNLLCSVTDNGRGFDPETAPGVLQGHFGLQGIQERIDELGGEFVVRSSCGKGTKATINIPIPHES